jgi:hypothetical protein
MRAQISRVYAHLGQHGAAIDLLDELHSVPVWLSVHVLEIAGEE